MEFAWNAASAPQYGYLNGFADDALTTAARDSGVFAGQTLDHALEDTTALGTDPFTYAFDTTRAPHSLDITALNPPAPDAFTFNHSGDGQSVADFDGDARRRGSSEEKEASTPAKSRRKAQNRAAQRAFRERKERHVRELEAKLNLLTTTTSSLQSDNERLKLMLQRARTENELLRATASSRASTSPGRLSDGSDESNRHSRHIEPASDHAPLFDRISLGNGLLTTTSGHVSGRPAGTNQSKSRLLSASATWDLIQSHPLYLAGAVDIVEICDRLKQLAQCDGMGPMFHEDQVRQLIEEVGHSGHDELI